MADPRKCFVSYARTDATRVEQLAGYVRDLGHEVWLDKELRGGQRWWDSILEQIRACDCFVFMVSGASGRSTACLSELAYARDLNRPILPVRLGPLSPDAPAPEDLAEIEYIDASAGPAEVVARIGHALLDLAPAEPLPDPLPERPPLPVSARTEPPEKPRPAAPRWLVWVAVAAAAVGVAFAYESIIDNLEAVFDVQLRTADIVGYAALSLTGALVGGWLGTRVAATAAPKRGGLMVAAVLAAVAALLTLGFSLAVDSFTAAMLLTFASIVSWGVTAFFGLASSGR